MQIGANRVRKKAMLSASGLGDAPRERTNAMADIEDDTLFSGLQHPLCRSAIYGDKAAIASAMIKVRQDITWPHGFEQLVHGNTRGQVMEHTRQAGRVGRFDSRVHGDAFVFRLTVSKRFGEPRLDTDNAVAMLLDAGDGIAGMDVLRFVKIAEVGFKVAMALHAVLCNVDQREHVFACGRHDKTMERTVVEAAGRASVDQGGDPRLEADVGSVDTEQAQARVTVHMQVDQSGDDEQTSGVDPSILVDRQVGPDFSDHVALDAHIASERRRASAVDDSSAVDQHSSSRNTLTIMARFSLLRLIGLTIRRRGVVGPIPGLPPSFYAPIRIHIKGTHLERRAERPGRLSVRTFGGHGPCVEFGVFGAYCQVRPLPRSQVRPDQTKRLLSNGQFLLGGPHRPGQFRGPTAEQLGLEGVFGWTDKSPTPEPFHLLVKGDRHRPGPVVQPGFLSAVAGLDRPLSPPPEGNKTSHHRLQFANWITKKGNPLTARVFVNRLWQHHFGEAIVRSPNNFGFKSDPPTHPGLLDWLAAEFMDGDWTIKRMHKLIMMSGTYRQASIHPQQESYNGRDFENRHLWRQNRRRVDAESLRDAMLTVCGQLNRSVGGESFYPRMSAEALEGLSRKGNTWGRSSLQQRRRRSIYMMTRRSRLLPFMTTFDFGDTTLPCGQRDVTTVTPQALALMNNHFVHVQSTALAERIADDTEADDTVKDPEAQIVRAWRLALGRSPTNTELIGALDYVQQQQEHFAAFGAGQLANRHGEEDLEVRDGLRLWLRADQGVSLDDQGGVMFWRDQAQPKHSAPRVASQAEPRYRPRV